METIQVGIESLVRGSINEPWKITFLTPVTDIRMTAVLGDGGVEVGPRLREVLTSIEKDQVYPRTITGRELELLGMATRDSFTIKMLSNMPAHIEIGFRPFRQFMNPVAPKIKGSYTEMTWTAEEILADELMDEEPWFSAMANAEGAGSSAFKPKLTSTIKENGYLLAGHVAEVKDGDTIAFTIERAGNIVDSVTDLQVGKTINVRFVGINTPETEEHGRQEGITRNQDYMKAYNVTVDQAFEVGKQAWDTLQSFLDGDGYVILDLDADLDGYPKTDPYGRYMAAVYKTSFQTANEAFESEFSAPQLNKTLLATMATGIKDTAGKAITNAPLAMPYYYFIDNEYSRLSPVDWLYEVGIRNRSAERIGDRLEEETKKKETTNPITDGTRIDVKTVEARSNQIDFMEAYDDRVEELFPQGIDHRVRIGDVMLTIPPLAIDANRISSIRKIKTLRSKSSMMIKGGSSATTITLQLYFHDLESINGRKEKMHPDKSRTYYMDGLRPLIAQFKKAPFVPIDNKYINETLGIDSVALVNLSVQTVPGFPHSIAASLTLAKFEHEAFMPQLSRLAEGMNYPMFRWYYQEPLRDDNMDRRSPYRTWLDPIPESGLTNAFTFQMVDEEDLITRRDAIENLRNLTNPLLMEERFENPTTGMFSGGDGSDTYTLLGKQYKDGLAAQRAMDMYSKYLSLKRAGKIPTSRDSDGSMKEGEHIAYDYTSKAGGRGTAVGASNVGNRGKELWKAIYGDTSENQVIAKSHYAPFESIIHEEQVDFSESEGGMFKLRLYANNNVDLFSDDETKGTSNELTSVVFSAKDIHKVRKIIERGKQAEDGYLKGLQDWNRAKAAVQATEADLTLRDFSIGGELLPTSVSVMYENQFSSAQLQALDGPTFQFLGGQDPYIQVTFEADETAIEDIRFMLEETERYAREYRTGITSGFLGINNHLMQLFGITTVMPESVQIRTVSGFPGRYQVEMTLVGFNKTQKRTEQLEGISPIYGDTVDRDDREAANYKAEADDAIIHYQMRKMELYPDLELPTYEELIESLPYMNAKCTVYENRTGGIYLDPDFYMATPVTSREFIREESKMNQELVMKDSMGVEMRTGSQYTAPLEGDQSMWSLLNSVDSRTQQISSTFSWSGNASSGSGGQSNSKEMSFASKEVEEYVKDRESLKNPPTYEEWKSMGIGNDARAYSNWKSKKKNPEDWEVYNEIYKWVDKLWVEKGYVYNDKNVSWKNGAWRKITYATKEDLWDANWNHLASKHPDSLKDGQKKVHKLDNITQKDFKATKNKVPRERIANMAKAVFHVRSKWRQMHSSGMPLLDGSGNAAGIGGVPLTSEAKDLKTAKRLLWDWKYNVEVAMKQLFEGYEAALKRKELEYKCRPWEWMVAAYATGTIETELKNQFWNQVHGIFSGYYNHIDKLYATPTSQMSLVIMQQRNGYSSRDMGVIQGDKDAIIETLLDMGYRVVKKDNWIREDEYFSRAESKKHLEKKTQQQMVDLYNKWIKEQFDSGAPMKEHVGSDHTMPVGEQIQREQNRENNPEAASLSDYISEGSSYIDNSINNRLVNQSMPQDAFPEMFTDMIHYDQRMRLLRAFPTFQMFIVDEGRWMTNYRLWDNLYGFNAIQSIDIHRSRKIAADTAIIEMTNVYSNLTSRSLDTTYEEWDYKFWDNLVWGNPNEKLLETRKELMDSLLLKTGARIHLRLGYGSSANDLPVVFNGTITEMNAEEMVTLVCQGDGVELGNVISGDPGDSNKKFMQVTEPRDLICKLLTSKGNWFKDVINYTSDGSLFKDNPLGIMHFGQPGEKVPEGTWKFFNTEYGEAAQNIYSSNGMSSFSQWTMADGNDIPWSWDTPVMDWIQPGDEDNVVVPFYNNTTWDIIQTLAYCSTDYIAAVMPFEMRSSLFFGKPYWSAAYTYDSTYQYDEKQKSWIRYRNIEHRKPFSQFHIFDSHMDIIGNKIKASEDGIFTNVIVNYDGKQTPVIYADFDIRFDKQKTTVLDAQIVSRVSGLDFWTSEKQAMYYGISAVRDYMKDMYKGELVVLGDPTIKPHDICYMQDTMMNMNGNFGVKAVTHQFSQETGFITSVQPDVMAVSDDMALLSVSNWGASLGAKFIGYAAAYRYGAKVLKKLIPSYVSSAVMKYGGIGATKATEIAISRMASLLPDDDVDVQEFKKLAKQLKELQPGSAARTQILENMQKSSQKIEKKLEKWDKQGRFTSGGTKVKGLKGYASMKRTVTAVKSATTALKDGKDAIKYIRWGGMAVAAVNPLSLLAAAVATWAVEGIAEKYRRKKATMQSVLIMPLMYQGRQYTAGINGHRGMVVGDPMGKIDSFLSGMGADGKNENDFSWKEPGTWLNNPEEWIMDTWNWLMDAEGKDYSVTEEDIRNGLQTQDGAGDSFWSE